MFTRDVATLNTGEIPLDDDLRGVLIELSAAPFEGSIKKFFERSPAQPTMSCGA